MGVLVKNHTTPSFILPTGHIGNRFIGDMGNTL